MTGFSADWLALREGADHRSRHEGLGAALTARFAAARPVRVIDLGAGTGSNLRATAPLLGPEQEWTLVDYDPVLLEEAALALHRWADDARAIGDDLVLEKGGRRIGVRFRLADLNAELEQVLAPKGGHGADLVTASALFDLISPAFMARFAKAVAAARIAFYTVLTYDGRDRFAPPHPADEAMVAAFAAHQTRDKGFGPAAGPKAAEALAEAFRAVGYPVQTGDSPWMLGPEDAALVRALVTGFSAAVAETGAVPQETVTAWRDFRIENARSPGALLVTGHTDILAFP